ncbi:MAG TPA: proline--tRNA ligase [Verrucomicrobiales bacterium]|nr:proline--tRNA ligase [Verrucomicrobiales bacterium]
MSESKAERPAIQPTRAEDFPQWYQQVVRAADLAESSEVRGCMVIKPWGYGLWEQIQSQLDRMFKDTGHQNAYFPLLIPLSFFEKEAEHAEGFATECAVVTHHRLETRRDESGAVRMIPAGPLTEPLVIRPTSETIIGAAFARWIQSYRDLPLLINQWANVMRWEMRPRLFLRTSEFLWQEGHTAHETREEACEETLSILRLYETFMRDHLALPVITGAKTESERFPGAEDTLCLEVMVQDRKAIQAGTSHFLGQNFARSSNIQFQGRDGTLQHAWTTSWGVSTRLIGTLIMAHGDDNGIVVPPRVAPTQAVILPVIPREDAREAVLSAAAHLAAELRSQTFHGEHLLVHVDRRDLNGGVKNWEWIKKGVPLRLEIGPRDLEKGTVSVSRRDLGPKHREFLPVADLPSRASSLLQEIQDGLLARATEHSRKHSHRIDTEAGFEAFFRSGETGGGFALAHWAGSKEDEARIKDTLQVTIRCLPFDPEFEEEGACFLTGRPSTRRVIFARSY